MARRSITLTHHNQIQILQFGSNVNTLRALYVHGTGRVAMTVNSGTDPDINNNSTDDNTRLMPAIPGAWQTFVETSAPPGQWEIRATLIDPSSAAIIEFDEYTN